MQNIKIHLNNKLVHSGKFRDEDDDFMQSLCSSVEKGLVKNMHPDDTPEETVLEAIHYVLSNEDNPEKNVAMFTAWMMRNNPSVSEIHYSLDENDEVVTKLITSEKHAA